MARMLTEEEMNLIEERRQQQQRLKDLRVSDAEFADLEQRRKEMAVAQRRQRVDAMHSAAADWRRNGQQRENERFANLVQDAQDTAFEQKRQRIIKNPSAETDTKLRNFVLRQAELDAARMHEAGMQGRELETRIKEAEQKRMGMENQGVGVATVRANADKDMLDKNLSDKEKQRQHEKNLLTTTQTFQGTQNDAERKNRLGIARVQGRSTVEAAKAQAEARSADISA